MKKIVIFILCSLIPFWSHAQNKAMSFRIGDKETHSRFVIDLEDNPEYKLFTLKNPNQIVIELDNTSWDGDIRPHKDNKLIKAVSRSTSGANIKVILDLTVAARINNFVIPPSDGKPYRLVLDLTPLKGSKFIPIPRKKEKPKPLPLIVIDAGHGGEDPGAVGADNTYEKDLTLEYSRELKKQLEKTSRYRVFMTREDDYYITLADRVKKARKVNGDIFISIHVNTHENKKIKGLSIYTLSESASDKEAEALAKLENKDGIISGLDLENESDEITDLLIDMKQRETKNLSASFAEMIIAKVEPPVELLHKPHRFAGFKVLTGADIPSILVEIGYLTNEKEAKLLKTKKYKKKLASAIVEAIDEHFKVYGF